MLVENGGTVVIGGIYEQDERTTINKVPVLGDLPSSASCSSSTIKHDDKTRAADLRHAADREGHADAPLTAASPRGTGGLGRAVFLAAPSRGARRFRARIVRMTSIGTPIASRIAARRQHLPRRHDGRGQDLGRARCSRSAWARRSTTPTTRSSARTGVRDPGHLRDRGRGRLPRARGAVLAELARAARHRARDRRRRGALRGEPRAAARSAAPWSTCARAATTCGSARATTATGRCCARADPLRDARASCYASATRSTARSRDLIVDTGSQSVGSLVDRLEQQLRRRRPAGADTHRGTAETCAPLQRRVSASAAIRSTSAPGLLAQRRAHRAAPAAEARRDRHQRRPSRRSTSDAGRRRARGARASTSCAIVAARRRGSTRTGRRSIASSTRCSRQRCERRTTLIALGGGVVGDLAGFAAATYQRGVPFIQVPTTLLAQVDSSVGGKTAINHPLGKNMIGAFYQPRAVIADTDTLRHAAASASSRAGLAEVDQVRRRSATPPSSTGSRTTSTRLVARDARGARPRDRGARARSRPRSSRADERETGERALLNFGHTFGHAIETGDSATAPGCTARRSPRAWCWRPSCRRALGMLDPHVDASACAALLERAGLPVPRRPRRPSATSS